MTQYINKDALVAKINKRINDAPINYIGHQRVWAYNDVKDIINTLEVKEVDLEKEMQAFAKLYLEPLKVYDANVGISITMHQLYLCAKHFFELGLSISNPITAADRGTAEEIIINLKRVEQDYHIDLTKEMEWVRNQVKKGE